MSTAPNTPVPAPPESQPPGTAQQQAAGATGPQIQSAAQQQTQTPAQQGSGRTGGTGPVGTGEHIVKDGECISSIAKNTGHFWPTIWDDPANVDVKTARKDPNVLLPGDRVHVPPIRRRQEPGQTEMRHRFVRKGEPSRLHLRIFNVDLARGNESFTLTVDGQEQRGITDPNGCLDVPIPGNAKTARLTFINDGTSYQLALGGVDPVSELSGVQRRLNNLGYDCGPEDNTLGNGTRAALHRFQAAKGLPETGEPDQQTRARLQEEHGS
jgi:hypothetical protein